jgi:hypothetical protein
MTAPEILREELADRRRRGEAFMDAWPGALAAALRSTSGRTRQEWSATLGGMQPCWRSAFDREPADGRVSAFVLIHESRDGGECFERECAVCGGEIDAERHPLAVYCSRDCYGEHKRAAARVAA